MSRWTHVVGCLYVDTHTENHNIKEYVEGLLELAPKITGSERDCDIFVNQLTGHNTWTNCDCDHCKYGNTIVHLDEKGGFQCDAENDFECPSGEYQTCVAITIIGDLRDKDANITKKEIKRFIRYIQYLGVGFDIDYCSVLIEDELEGKYSMKIKYNEDDYTDKGEILWIEM